MVLVFSADLGAIQTFLSDTLAVLLSCMDDGDDCSLLRILMMILVEPMMKDDFDGALRWMSSDRDCLRDGHTCPPCPLMISMIHMMMIT